MKSGKRLSLTAFIEFSTMGLLVTFALATIAVSFLCSLLEATLMTTPLTYLTMKEEEGDKSAIRFKKLKTDIDRPLSAILILNTIANTIGATLVGARAASVWNSTAVGIVSGVMTVLILIFSEIIPKTLGASWWKSLIGFAGRTIRMLTVILYPLVLIAELITRVFEKKDADVLVSREEVSAMANAAEEDGEIDKGENKIIQNIIKLDSVKAYDVMTPRVVARTAPESMTLKQFYKDSAYMHYSRIPVYADSPEYITGYILRSTVLEFLADDKFDVKLGDIKRNIDFFNEEMSIGDIWERLLENKEQIGLIIDEYGGFKGIITLEDIIETIFGLEIIDEMDEYSDMQQYARERWKHRQKKYETISLPS